jgi:hypothetical protein
MQVTGNRKVDMKHSFAHRRRAYGQTARVTATYGHNKRDVKANATTAQPTGASVALISASALADAAFRCARPAFPCLSSSVSLHTDNYASKITAPSGAL